MRISYWFMLWLTLCLLCVRNSLGQLVSSLPPEAIRISQLSKMPVSRDRDTVLACLHDSCARHWIIQGLPQRADEHLRRFEEISKKYAWPYGEALLFYRKGHYQTVLGNATKAKTYFLSALERLIHLNHPDVLLATYTQMGANELDSDLSDSAGIKTAIKYLREGRQLSLKTTTHVFYSALCYHLGRAYLQLRNYTEAHYYLTESWNESQRTGYREMPFYHCLLFTVCYTHVGDEKRRRQTWNRCRSFLPNLNAQEYYDYYSALADIHLFQKEYALMLSDGRNIGRYAALLRSPTKVLQSHRVVFAAYKFLKQSEAALRELETIKLLEDSTSRQRSKVLLAEVQLKYNTKQQQEELARLTINQQRQTQRLLLGGLIALLLLSGYVFYNNRQLRQKNRAISAASLQGQTLERQRVAADLHDNLGTTLSALHWNLEAIDKTKLSTIEQAVYTTINQQVSQAYNDVRLLSHNLLPNELAKQGLAAALRSLVERMNRNTPVRFRLTGADTLPRLDQQTEFELYSICLELLNNTIKHARATEGFIDLTLANGMLYMTVGDNGTGVANERADGRGLHNVAARVDSVAGTWVVDSTPDGGVQHQITVPVRIPVRASSQT